jgi:hypothetical protein
MANTRVPLSVTAAASGFFHCELNDDADAHAAITAQEAMSTNV